VQRAWPGLTVILAGAALTQVGPVRGLPLFGYVAIALLLVGTVMLMPRIAVLAFRLTPSFGSVLRAGARAAARGAGAGRGEPRRDRRGREPHGLDGDHGRLVPPVARRVAGAHPARDLYLRTGPGSDTAYLSPGDQQAIARLPGIRRTEFMRVQRVSLDPDKPLLTLLARAVEAEGRVPPLLGPAHRVNAGDPPPRG